MGVANLRLDNQQGGGRCTSFHHKFHLMCQAPPSRPHRAAPVLHAQQAPQQPHPPAPSGCTDTAGAGAALCQELPAPAGTKALCAGPVAWLCLTMCPGEQEPPTACCSWGRREGRATQGQGITLQLYLPCEPSAAFSHVLLTCTIPSHSSQTSHSPATKKSTSLGIRQPSQSSPQEVTAPQWLSTCFICSASTTATLEENSGQQWLFASPSSVLKQLPEARSLWQRVFPVSLLYKYLLYTLSDQLRNAIQLKSHSPPENGPKQSEQKFSTQNTQAGWELCRSGEKREHLNEAKPQTLQRGGQFLSHLSPGGASTSLSPLQ